MSDYITEFGNLLVALAIGLLIGVERGWAERGVEEGGRVAGIRTFGLISLLGALWQLLANDSNSPLAVWAFLGFSLLLAVSSYLEIQKDGDRGITTPVAALIAFALGALAMTMHAKLAMAAAVITTILLGLKPILHGGLRKLEFHELSAALKLLLISCVMLPILPDRTLDPWETFNPYEIWWVVVAISAISFTGYFAIKLAGPSRGILLTGLFAGLVSSTAATLSMSRMGKTHPSLQKLLAAGVTMASTTMFLRILLIAGFLQPALFKPLAGPLILMAVSGYGAVWALVRNSRGMVIEETVDLKNPFEFGMALRFGALLALIMLLTKLLQTAYGSAGVFIMAGISGISDVDAITISLARMPRTDYSVPLFTLAIVFAVMVNTLVKAGLAVSIAGGLMARCVVYTFLSLITVGVASLWLL
jgi:uncharacterized membrane protein (DUF4010 family)